jgi:exonuclease 3'-5' domain-containing protein 1
MENAARRGNKRLLHGLAKCTREDSGLSAREKANWEQVKEKGLKLFAIEKGGRPDVFNVRPLSEDLTTYCVQDVTSLPSLYALYGSKIDEIWASWVRKETKRRLVESMSAEYKPHGSHKELAPVWRNTDARYDSDEDYVLDEMRA